MADCPQGLIYLLSLDVSAFVNDVDALQLILDGAIQEAGIDKVIQMIACSTEGWLGAVGKQFKDRCKTAFWTVSATHCIELMLEKIGMMSSVKVVL